MLKTHTCSFLCRLCTGAAVQNSDSLAGPAEHERAVGYWYPRRVLAWSWSGGELPVTHVSQARAYGGRETSALTPEAALLDRARGSPPRTSRPEPWTESGRMREVTIAICHFEDLAVLEQISSE